jgi:monoamine oxidase
MSEIVIIGAGLAGLAAALELTAHGRDVLVLEARDRPGGRVHTLRDFDDGLYAEAGAARIPDTHALTRAYVARFGLALEPFRPAPPALFIRGTLVDRYDDETTLANAMGLDIDDRRFPPRALVAELEALAARVVGDSSAAGWPGPELARWDAMSVDELARGLGASPRVAAWLDVGGGIIGPRSSALLYLRELVLNHSASLARIAGGNDRLPRAMAAQLGERVRYGAAVRCIEPGTGAVRLAVEHANGREELTAARVICAIPFAVLRRLELAPAFGAAKMRAIREMHYTPVSRAFVQTRERIWHDRLTQGFVMTDHPMDVFDATWGQPGTRGILMTYARDALAERLAALESQAHVEFAVETLERIFPGVRGRVERATTVCWGTDEWARGACADELPGQLVALRPHAARAEGRVHFAGEHTSPWSGWMQGALESGERSAREVLAALEADTPVEARA